MTVTEQDGFWVQSNICLMLNLIHYFIELAAHSAVVLKAENMPDKVGWINKIQNITGLSKATSLKGADSEANPAIRQSHSDGSLVSSDMVQYHLSLLGR